jgi:hypothetical protein
MKRIYKILFILLTPNLGFSQTNQTVFDNNKGLSVTYSIEKDGKKTNPETGFEFNKYKLTVIVNNQTDKFYAVDGSLQYDGIKSGVVKNKSDDRFHHNNNDATVNHFCIEDNCIDFPSQGTAAKPHQIICPNSSQKCEKEFLHPDVLASPATVSWFGWGFTEMIGKITSNSRNTEQTNALEQKDKLIWDKINIKMKNAVQEIANYVSENVDPIATGETKIVRGKTVEVIKYYKCLIIYSLDGCTGEINDIDVKGENINFDNNVKKTLLQLNNKYTIMIDDACLNYYPSKFRL